MDISDSVKCKKNPGTVIDPGAAGYGFIKTGGVLAGSAGYFFKLAGYGRDTGWVSQLLET